MTTWANKAPQPAPRVGLGSIARPASLGRRGSASYVRRLRMRRFLTTEYPGLRGNSVSLFPCVPGILWFIFFGFTCGSYELRIYAA
jgi:hypothetical protein